MFVLIAVAVGMCIHSGMRLERFKSLEQGFQLPYALKMELQRSKVLYAPTYRFSLITGVCLCVLSPALIFAAAYVNDDFTPYGVAAFLLMAAEAVFLFTGFVYHRWDVNWAIFPIAGILQQCLYILNRKKAPDCAFAWCFDHASEPGRESAGRFFLRVNAPSEYES